MTSYILHYWGFFLTSPFSVYCKHLCTKVNSFYCEDLLAILIELNVAIEMTQNNYKIQSANITMYFVVLYAYYTQKQ